MKLQRTSAAFVGALGLVVGATVAAVGSTTGTAVDACYAKQNGQLRVVVDEIPPCRPNERPLSLSTGTGTGAAGATGDTIPLITLSNGSGVNKISVAGGTSYTVPTSFDGGVLLDGSMYPVGRTVRVTYFGQLAPPSRPGGPIQSCLRLFDVTAGASVPESEMCASGPAFTGEDGPVLPFDWTSPPLTVADVGHRYVIQFKNSEPGGQGDVTAAEFTIRW